MNILEFLACKQCDRTMSFRRRANFSRLSVVSCQPALSINCHSHLLSLLIPKIMICQLTSRWFDNVSGFFSFFLSRQPYSCTTDAGAVVCLLVCVFSYRDDIVIVTLDTCYHYSLYLMRCMTAQHSTQKIAWLFI